MLFSPDDIQLPPVEKKTRRKRKPKPPRPGDAAIRVASTGEEHGKVVEAVRLGDLRELVPTFQRGEVLHLVASGLWSNYDLLEHLVGFTGPADLWLATWGISNPGVSRIAHLLHAGKLRRATALIDSHMVVQRSGAASFLASVCDRFGAYPCHAKVYILRNESWGVSIVTSANLTSNPRLEAGVVTDNATLADWHIGWIENALDLAPPFNRTPGMVRTIPLEETNLSNVKRLYLVRGLPGTGKTATARELAGWEATHSNDDHFESGGEYRFDIRQMPEAARECMAGVARDLRDGVSPIAVANTFSCQEEAQPYIDAARAAGYTVAIIECQTEFGNIHGVSQTTVERMRKRWQTITTTPKNQD